MCYFFGTEDFQVDAVYKILSDQYIDDFDETMDVLIVLFICM